MVAEFRESFGAAIRQIISFFKHDKWYINVAGAEALAKLSTQSKVSTFLIQRC